MRLVCPLRLRQAATTLLALGGLVALATPASAQGFGLGGRITWVTSDAEADVDAVRMLGGQVRLLGGRFGLEVAMDRHSEEFEFLKVTETPIQASLLMRMGSGRVAPFLLGGPGWYRTGDPRRQTFRHPRRLPLHLSRLQR